MKRAVTYTVIVAYLAVVAYATMTLFELLEQLGS
jgi:hypothetical protein